MPLSVLHVLEGFRRCNPSLVMTIISLAVKNKEVTYNLSHARSSGGVILAIEQALAYHSDYS